jgi:hypothetical protein
MHWEVLFFHLLNWWEKAIYVNINMQQTNSLVYLRLSKENIPH